MKRKHAFFFLAITILFVGSGFFFTVFKGVIYSDVDSEQLTQDEEIAKNEHNEKNVFLAKRADKNRTDYITKNDVEKFQEDRVEKVQDALEKFKQRTDHLSREIIMRDLETVAESRKKLEARPTSEPIIEPYTDEQGNRWNKLTYETGAVRYEIIEE